MCPLPAVAGHLSVDAEQVYTLIIDVSSSCVSYTVNLEVAVLPVLIDVYLDESENSFSFVLDHFEVTESKMTSAWILPQTYIVQVTLPDVASPSDYYVALIDGTLVGLTSLQDQFQIQVTVAEGVYAMAASLVLATDPFVQLADDEEDSPSVDWLKSITKNVEKWTGDLAQSGFKSVIKSQMSEPYDEINDQLTTIIQGLDPVDDLQTIQTLQNFQQNQLPTLRDQMATKVLAIVFNEFELGATITIPDGSKAHQALDKLDAVDTTGAFKHIKLTPIIKANILDDQMKQQVLQGNLQPLIAKISNPGEIFDELHYGVKLSFDTESLGIPGF